MVLLTKKVKLYTREMITCCDFPQKKLCNKELKRINRLLIFSAESSLTTQNIVYNSCGLWTTIRYAWTLYARDVLHRQSTSSIYFLHLGKSDEHNIQTIFLRRSIPGPRRKTFFAICMFLKVLKIHAYGNRRGRKYLCRNTYT